MLILHCQANTEYFFNVVFFFVSLLAGQNETLCPNISVNYIKKMIFYRQYTKLAGKLKTAWQRMGKWPSMNKYIKALKALEAWAS